MLDGGAPKVSVEHARHIVEVVLASYDADRTGRSVLLGENAEELNAGLALTDVG